MFKPASYGMHSLSNITRMTYIKYLGVFIDEQ